MQPARLSRQAAAILAALTLLSLLAAAPGLEPPPAMGLDDPGVVGLGLALRRLPVSGRVLYATAHPDDEDNGVLVMLNRGRGLRTALLTATRGEGGQNEIGPELGEPLGLLRTGELAAVHEYDGAEQYFTRAYEFGFSFSVDETFQKWGHDEILADFVRVVRSFRPDVILTLPLQAPGGGQHHQAAGRLAAEAFRAAADPARFPEQIQAGLRPWQARKIYEGGTGGPGEVAPAGAVVETTGQFDPVLGLSWYELGGIARTFHRCQGASQLRPAPGGGLSPYRLVDSEPRVDGLEKDILDGVDSSLPGLVRFRGAQAAPFLAPGLDALDAAARRAQEAWDPRAPQRTASPLADGLTKARALLTQVESSGLAPEARAELAERLSDKVADFERALTLALGLTFEATVDDGDVVPGQSFKVTARAFDRGASPLAVEELAVVAPAGWEVTPAGPPPSSVPGGAGVSLLATLRVAEDARSSRPYWHREPGVDRYTVDVPAHQGLPWSPPDVQARLRYRYEGASATVVRPAVWRYEGKPGGEKRKVLNVVPALSLRLTPELAVWPLVAAGTTREVRVSALYGGKSAAAGTVHLEAPVGWTVAPLEAPLRFTHEGEEVGVRFQVRAPRPLVAGNAVLRAVARLGGREFAEGYQAIAYPHIEERHYFRPSTGRLEAFDVRLAEGAQVGYVMGAGDEVPRALEQLGARVTLLGPDDLAFGDLARFSTLMTGIRAYQTRSDLRAQNARVLKYVEDGGHLVVQYNKFEFNQLTETPTAGFSGQDLQKDPRSPFAPYPAAVSSDRVTVEEAPVRLLAPEAEVLNRPNRIGPQDFEGWVQERGLYFLAAKDPRYRDLLASADPWPNNAGEKKGMLVEATVGKGTWTYVGLGLWRQLPAGVPGAYRLLANLVSRPRAR